MAREMLTLFEFPPLPTEIVFGFGAVMRLGEKLRQLGVSRPLVIGDRGVAQAGVLATAQKVLSDAGIEFCSFDDVPQDSSTGTVATALALLNAEQCDGLVGVGGGSVLDTAKAVAVSKTNPGPLTEYAGLGKVKNPPLPVVAIPTTAGTGSEVSYWAVLTNDDTALKFSIGGQLVFPKVAICDPELTMTLPSPLTASTGMDALTHAIESYVNNATQPISQALSLRAVELIGTYLRGAAVNGRDREARYGMMLASTLAGIAMNPTRLGIAHALAMPLGSWDLKIPHGVANAILLPNVMEFNLPANIRAFAEIARALGENTYGLSPRDAAQKAVEAVRTLQRDIGIAYGLAHFGLTERHIPRVVEEAMKSGNIAVNPRRVLPEHLREICLRSL